MARKLNNASLEEYINKFDSYKGAITVKDFCIENELTKNQFYYHKKRLEKIENIQPVFQSISLKNNANSVEQNTFTLKEVKINIGNANITISVSETTLIASIIKELAGKCYIDKIDKVYLACGYTDLRKSIDGLVMIVQNQFKLDPFDKALFVFCNKQMDKLKILHFDEGFWLYYHRLEANC